MPSLNINVSHSKPRSPLELMHYHLDTNPSSLAKRDRARLMNRCTDSMRGYTFTRSACTRTGGLRSLIILCHDNSGLRAAGHSCALNEFCFDTGFPATQAKAYCVSSDNFFQVPRSEPQRVEGEFGLHFPRARGRRVASALLVDQARRSGLKGAELFELAAWRSGVGGLIGEGDGAERRASAAEIGNSAAAKPLVNRALVGESLLDAVHCANCYDLRLQPLPPETDLLKAKVDIWHAQPGVLYLITIS